MYHLLEEWPKFSVTVPGAPEGSCFPVLGAVAPMSPFTYATYYESALCIRRRIVSPNPIHATFAPTRTDSVVADCPLGGTSTARGHVINT